MAITLRNRVKEYRLVPASDIVLNPHNPRRHGEAQRAALRAVLEEIGFAGAILAYEKDGKVVCVDGAMRREELGNSTVGVLITDLTQDEADALLLYHDQITGMAGYDPAATLELLALRSEEQNTALVELNEAMREQAEAALDAATAAAEDLGSDDGAALLDKAGELQIKWQTALGQLWRVGQHHLWCGDSRQPPAELFADKKIRMVWTDPPYGVSYSQKTDWMEEHGAQKQRRPIANDDLKPAEVGALFAGALKAAAAHADIGASCYATVPSVLLAIFIAAFEQGGFSYKHGLVWLKQSFVMGRSDYHYRHEPILYGWIENGAHYFVDDRTHDSVFEVDRPQASDLHPTTKPVELVAAMIKNSSRRGEVVYDPFSGSGTVLVACEQLARRGCAVELDPAYAAVALERLAALGLNPEMVLNAN